MTDISDILRDALSATGTSMHEIRTAIRKQRGLQGESTDLVAADELAFSFRESDEAEAEPDFQSARLVQDPARNQITVETIAHWGRRANTTSNSVLRARYADLAWEFARDAGLRRDPAFARTAIDAYAEAVGKRQYTYQHDAIRAVGRALHLARLLRDAGPESRNCCSVGGIPTRDCRRLLDWSMGLLVDRLVINRGTSDPGLIASLVADLEERLARLTGPGVTAVDARAIEAAALRLATHYRARNESDDVSRVLRLFRGAYEKAAAEENPLVAYAWLERVHGVLVSYNLRVDAEQLAIVLRGYAKKGLGSMSEISVDVPVPSDKLEEFLKAIFDGSVDEALTRIALRYVPRRTDFLQESKEQRPFHFREIFRDY